MSRWKSQWSLWPQVSDGCNGTSRLPSLMGRCWSCPESEPGRGLEQGGACTAGEHRDYMAAHGMSTITGAVQDWRAPLSLRLQLRLCSSRHPVRGTPGEEGATGQRIFGEWLEAPGTRCQTWAFHSATEEHLGPEDSGSSPRPWPTHGDLGKTWLTSFCQPLRCVSLSFCYLVSQIHVSVPPGKRQTATHKCPASRGRRGEASGVTIALKFSGCP